MLIKKIYKKITILFFALLLALSCIGLVPTPAKAEFYEPEQGFKCYSYDVELTVREDRTIYIEERMDVEALRNFNMFYKSLPTDSIYTEITGKCEGNDAFYFYVMDNPDMDGFIDLCCEGNVSKGNRWVYEFSYIMQPNGEDIESGMILDVVGFGTSFDLNEVTVTVNFPEKPETCLRSFGGYGSSNGLVEVTDGWSEDGKTLTIYEECLPVSQNSLGEFMAEGITLQFTCAEGVLKDFYTTRIMTERIWLTIGLCVVLMIVALAMRSYGKKHGEIVPIVNIKAPDEMDPMEMGYLLDGMVDNEDVTSMLYYFACKGYLTIDFTDEHDPVLERVKNPAGGFVELPADAPAYQKTLLNGLFGNKQVVRVSELNEKFYVHVDEAKMQMLLKKRKRYEKKSIASFLVCSVASAIVGFSVPALYSLIFVGGGYLSSAGIFCAVFAVISAVLWFAIKEMEFKRAKRLWQGVLVGLSVIFGGAFMLGIANHLMVEGEKLLLVLCMITAQALGYFALSRTEEYNKILGDILGFKDFIKVTEEDKIKFMLEQNPELYYDILPYAQVLDVTDEWEDKFKNITLEPPKWAVYNDPYFNYMMINRSMRSARHAMLSRPQNTSATGKSGGGGSFGGFAGGGRGGGGFGGR